MSAAVPIARSPSPSGSASLGMDYGTRETSTPPDETYSIEEARLARNGFTCGFNHTFLSLAFAPRHPVQSD